MKNYFNYYSIFSVLIVLCLFFSSFEVNGQEIDIKDHNGNKLDESKSYWIKFEHSKKVLDATLNPGGATPQQWWQIPGYGTQKFKIKHAKTEPVKDGGGFGITILEKTLLYIIHEPSGLYLTREDGGRVKLKQKDSSLEFFQTWRAQKGMFKNSYNFFRGSTPNRSYLGVKDGAKNEGAKVNTTTNLSDFNAVTGIGSQFVKFELWHEDPNAAKRPTPLPASVSAPLSGKAFYIKNTYGGSGHPWYGALLSWDPGVHHPIGTVEKDDPVEWEFHAVPGKAHTYKIYNLYPDRWKYGTLSWDTESPHPMISVEIDEAVEWRMDPVSGKTNTYKIVSTWPGAWDGASISWDSTNQHPKASLEFDDPVEWELVPAN